MLKAITDTAAKPLPDMTVQVGKENTKTTNRSLAQVTDEHTQTIDTGSINDINTIHNTTVPLWVVLLLIPCAAFIFVKPIEIWKRWRT